MTHLALILLTHLADLLLTHLALIFWTHLAALTHIAELTHLAVLQTLVAKTLNRIQAFEMKCTRKLLRISYLEHRTNEYVRNTVDIIVGAREPLLVIVKRLILT